MGCRGLYVFSHDSELGRAPSHVLFEKVRVKRRADVEFPRQFADYEVDIDETLPEGVSLTRVCG